jgi:hypothetical protein
MRTMGPWRLVLLVPLMAAGAAFLGQGCVQSVPPLASVVATSTPTFPPDLVSNFEDGSVKVNPNLENGRNGYWIARTYGGAGATLVSGGVTTVTTGNQVNEPFVVPNAVPDATDASRFAAHIFAPLIAAGAYESDQLACYPLGGAAEPGYPYYDAGAFPGGIRFLINVPADDTNTYRVLQVAIDQTLPAGEPGGACAPTTVCSCYNHFEAALPAGSTAGWVAISHPWSDFTVPSCPGSVTPAGLDKHLDRIIFLQFLFSSGSQGSTSSPVSTTTDFWVDDVRFLP